MASAIKMCRNIMIKGLEALVIESYAHRPPLRRGRPYCRHDWPETFPVHLAGTSQGPLLASAAWCNTASAFPRAEEMRESAQTGCARLGMETPDGPRHRRQATVGGQTLAREGVFQSGLPKGRTLRGTIARRCAGAACASLSGKELTPRPSAVVCYHCSLLRTGAAHKPGDSRARAAHAAVGVVPSGEGAPAPQRTLHNACSCRPESASAIACCAERGRALRTDGHEQLAAAQPRKSTPLASASLAIALRRVDGPGAEHLRFARRDRIRRAAPRSPRRICHRVRMAAAPSISGLICGRLPRAAELRSISGWSWARRITSGNRGSSSSGSEACRPGHHLPRSGPALAITTKQVFLQQRRGQSPGLGVVL